MAGRGYLEDWTRRACGVALRVRVLRIEMGLSQESLGELVGVGQGVVQKIENGHSIHPTCIEPLAKVLGVSPGWLQFGDAAESPLSAEACGMALMIERLSKRGREVVRLQIRAVESLESLESLDPIEPVAAAK